MCLSKSVCVRVSVGAFVLVCMCVCGDVTGRALPVHGYLPEATLSHRHPLEVPPVVGGVHSAEQHHAALLVVAGLGGEVERESSL